MLRKTRRKTHNRKHTLMTKSNELAILTDAVQKLGSDSYCGDWLKSVLPEVEWLMRSDMIPTLTISETRSQCDAMRKEAVEHCDKITYKAVADADKIVNDAYAKANGIRMMLKRDIQKALEIV